MLEEPGTNNAPINTNPIYHIVFLHSKLRKRSEDRYVIDIAKLLKHHGHKVIIYTSDFDPTNCLDEVNPLTGEIPVVYSGWWLPNSLKCLKSVIMALRVIFFSGVPKPKFVFLDIHPFALFVLSKFSNYKTIYFQHFSNLKHADFYSDYMLITSQLITAKCLRYADEIITQTKCLAEVFQKSYPRIQKDIKCINSMVDSGLWTQDLIDVHRIIPDLSSDSYLYVVFGNYSKRSNLRLALDAFEQLLLLLDNETKMTVHLVIAGYCSETSFEQKCYYNELTETTKEKYFASQVTFLRQLPTIHKRTLIERSIAVIYTTKHDPFPDTILAAICFKRPIITTNTGFAKEVLTHRISGILVDADPNKFAAAMYKILMNPAIERFISDMAYDLFRTQYSFNAVGKKLNNLMQSYAKVECEGEKNK